MHRGVGGWPPQEGIGGAARRLAAVMQVAPNTIASDTQPSGYILVYLRSVPLLVAPDIARRARLTENLSFGSTSDDERTASVKLIAANGRSDESDLHRQ